ncbi:MAG: ABC transporter substrate-binding protein [Magnetococcales bacterium]|nr:ABC transporter substrate-binding protein [Magnetococcales bacterium]
MADSKPEQTEEQNKDDTSVAEVEAEAVEKSLESQKKPNIVIRFFSTSYRLIKKLWLLILFAVSFTGVYLYDNLPKIEKEPIHLAFVGPMTGKSASNGISMERGVQLYIRKINKAGGINGRKVILEVYDDQNNPDFAQKAANDLVAKNKALAVIGHNYSSSSIRAGKIYKKHKIPALSPTATDINVTKSNPWYFRTIFNNDSQGRFLANYVNKILLQKRVSIIEEKSVHGESLAKIFRETTEKIGGKIVFQEQFSQNHETIDQEVKQLVDNLSKVENPGLIFLSTHGPEGVKLIKEIKDKGIFAPIAGSDALASEEFIKDFNQHRKERIHLGYYTNDIIIMVPIIFDAASERVQAFYEDYQESFSSTPDWRSAFAHDSALVLLKAIENGGISGDIKDIAQDRVKIRDYLANLLLPEEAIEGVTGYNYFDKYGDTPKPIAVGVYKNQRIVSALTQLKTIRDPKLLTSLKKSYDENLVVPIDDKFMFRTNIVKSGFKVNSIKELDIRKQTYKMDFTIWFRFQGEIDTSRILFNNALEPIKLGEPLEEHVIKDITYRVYRTSGNFKANFMPSHNVFGRYILGFSFRHMDLPKDNLIFVTDVLGMGLVTQGAQVQNIESMSDVLSPDSGWSVSKIWMYQDIIQSRSLGNPKFLSSEKGGVSFSQFNFGFQVKSSRFTLRDLISREYAKYLMILSLFATIFLARNANYSSHIKKNEEQ